MNQQPHFHQDVPPSGAAQPLDLEPRLFEPVLCRFLAASAAYLGVAAYETLRVC